MAASNVRSMAQPLRVPMNVAFAECVDIVLDVLKARGEQWSSEAKQDAVSTLFLGAQKQGLLVLWESPSLQAEPAKITALPGPAAQRSPAVISSVPAAPPAVAASAETELSALLRASVERARDRHHQPSSAPAPAAEPADAREKAEGWFPVMLRAFRVLETELPPELYAGILDWYHVRAPSQFTADQRFQAISCYVTMKQARDDYRRQIGSDPTSFQHFEANQ